MADYRLLLQQKNEVFELVLTQGLNPNEFEWKELESQNYGNDLVSKLEYRGSRYFFLFDFDSLNDDGYAVYSPARNKPTETVTLYPGWQNYLPSVVEWLSNLEAELSQPDRWAELDSIKFIEDGRLRKDLNNDRFSVDQVEKITAAIEDLKAHISSEFGLTKDSIEEVNTRLDYLETAVDRLGKFDWANTTVGVLTSLVTGSIFSPDQAKNVWEFIWNSLRGILQLPQ